MITHASIYDRHSVDGGFRVLVTRHWPRGVRKDQIDLWLKDASPSRELLDAYHRADVTWEEFEQRYRSEILDERPHVLEELRELDRDHDGVTLLCFERLPPAEHCHRLVLLELLLRTGAIAYASQSARPRPAPRTSPT
jgi:uncharacterized protein YeaO (DUF488 family)